MDLLDAAIVQASSVVEAAIAEHHPVAVYALVSGGNDSTVMSHLARYFGPRLDAIVHINTGIGIEATRRFVRETWAPYLDLPLIERYSPRPEDSYESLVLEQGFPGPAAHRYTYIRLKERAVEQVMREAKVGQPRSARVLLLTGARSAESGRRMGHVEPIYKRKAQVWVAPLHAFTDEQMRTYRTRYHLPVNEVTVHLHMSGECLCGAFAHEGELAEIAFFYPEDAQRIRALQERVRQAGKHCVWGTRPPGSKAAPPTQSPGILCQDCQIDTSTP